ncbi:hypothetical protein FIV42_12505 [Persicimonas caeni]|uniref:S1/P1 nuclease n=2 Tax=Persicimonas caeni TaxID=2292766 RepID=A0A4Y6PT80_PERCE|nr:hypothetical protein FIV42_12505 [Persicimonas caeni]
MSRSRLLVVLCTLALGWLAPPPASAFYILSPKSEPCHERLMLGALGAEAEPFGSAGSAGPKLVSLLTERVRASGVPDDEETRAFVDETAQRYGFSAQSWAEKFVLASFVAGVRQPDTDGLSVIKFNETRSLHLQDGNQPKHSLRQSDHDYEGGDAAAIERAREVVVERLERARSSWQTDEELLERARWSFAYYGEVDVWLVAAAFHLGRAAHVVQDAYAHTLRDDEMRVVAMSNFVDVVEERYFEPRDGPAHSKRLDKCDTDESAFDEMRVVEAREATVELVAVLGLVLSESASRTRLEELLDRPLNRVYTLREGCTVDNAYCGSAWAPLAASEPTEPYNLTLCATGDPSSPRSLHGALIAAAVASLVVVWRLARARGFRSRSRRSTA